MSENKTVGIEVWACAADRPAIWVAGRDAWRDGPVKADTTMHFTVQQMLFEHGIDPDDTLFVKLPEVIPPAQVIHSTSWRDEGPMVMHTYMAVVRASGFVLDMWPGAVPVTSALPAETGRPRPHRAAAPPEVRVSDVLLHGLRHLKFLISPWGDAEVAAALDRNWRRHLHGMKPALATMYTERLAG